MAGWWRAFLIVSVAAAGAAMAALSDGKAWGTVIGGLCGAFAPSLLECSRVRADAHAAVDKAAELTPEMDGAAALLHPARRVVPFTGRERELAELLAWCGDTGEGRLRLVTGGGGVGKSRLAAELARRLGEGWGVVEVADDTEAEALERWRAVSEGRVLLIVDYAETRTGLAVLLREAAGDDGRRVRVLLLARSIGEWWQQLGAEPARVRQMVAAAGASGIELSEQVQTEVSDRELVAAAVPYFAAALGVAAPKRFEIVLGEGSQRILDLHAAALVTVLRSARQETCSGEVVVRVEEVIEEVLGHERRFWVQSARARGLMEGPFGLSEEAVRQSVAAAILLGAKDREQATEIVARVPDGVASVRVADWLRELYSPEDDREWLGRLRPDRLSELHVTRELSGSAALLEACLEGLDMRQGRRALVTLARAAQELEAAAEILQPLLPVVAIEVGTVPASRETLAALYEILPYPSMSLAEAHALLAQRLLDSIPVDTDPAERARWLSVLGVHLSALGRLAEALSVMEEAVTIYRELAGLYPDRYRRSFARCLSNLGPTFSALGRLAEALSVTEEAVTICRELAGLYPDRYRPDFARSLSNLSTTFLALGRLAEALSAMEEAVIVYRELVKLYPDRFRLALANSLFNLGIVFSELERPTDAARMQEEAGRLRELTPDRDL
ncbi:tetratricopeptide repeat protein [Streptosporangium roseum]|uniref:tetratricopeptide repeat protein n=1 Tax=Streptosporangium roseum TaxID=2001 RepID=UPI00331BE627